MPMKPWGLRTMMLLPLISPLVAAATRPATQPATRPAASDVAREVDALLPQLAAADYRARERAQDRLVQIGPPARDALARYVAGTANAEGRTGATIVLQRIADGERLGPTFVTLRRQDVGIGDVCAELSRTGGLTVTAAPDHRWPRAALDLQHRPYWAAVRQVCDVFSARPVPDLPNGRLELVPDPAWAKRPWHSSTGALVVFDSADLIAKRDVDLDRDFSRNTRLRFEVFPDPAYRGLTHLHYLNLTEAIDEHGQSLLPKESLGQSVSSGSGSFSFEAGVSSNPGKRISAVLASFKGTAGLLVQSRAARIEIDDPAAARDVTRAAAGVRLTVHSVARRPDGWDVHVTLVRDGADERVWDIARTLYAPLPVQLRDAGGDARAWVLQSGKDRKAQDDRVDGVVTFLDTGGPAAAARRPPPVKLVWELPAETKELEIPIEFKGLSLP